MITVIPRHWFTWDFALFQDGTKLAEARTSAWRERGTLAVGGAVFRVQRERIFSGAFQLEKDGTVIARAWKPSAFTRRLVIDAGGIPFELRPRNPFSRSFGLFEGERRIGTLSAAGIFSRRMHVNVPERVSLPLSSFMVWLTFVLWMRDSNAG